MIEFCKRQFFALRETELFNSITQGSAYGDDDLSATNYPLMRITNLETGNVFYSRIYNRSYIGIANKKRREFIPILIGPLAKN